MKKGLNIIVILMIAVVAIFLTWVTILRFGNLNVLTRECVVNVESSHSNFSQKITYTYEDNKVLKYKSVSETEFFAKEDLQIAKDNDTFIGDPYEKELGKSGYYKASKEYSGMKRKAIVEINFDKIDMKKMKDVANQIYDFWYGVIKDNKVEPKEIETIFYTCVDK